MGLLDDAIREHLELKRQRGADQGEVSRLEQEALGPVVRGDEFATDATSAGDESLPPEYEPMDAHAPAAAEYDHPLSDFEPSVPALEQEPFAPEPEPVAPEPVAPEPVEPEFGQHVGQPTEEFDVESVHAQEALRSAPPEPEAAAPAPVSHEPLPPAPAPPAPQPAHDDHDAQQPAKTGEHDVLEDTPEFLQETPEHDRLWFEQGPPQEFDFDK
jgi:hypothetical protein